jgi:hypothetical protein
MLTAASDASGGLHAALDLALLLVAGDAEIAEDDVGDAAVHGARHEQRQQAYRRADDHAGDHQRRVLQHVAFEADREPGEGVVQRDDDGMSAPPIGIVISTPKISAPTKNAANDRGSAWPCAKNTM